MKKIRVAVVGYGNIGRYCLESVAVSPDMELAGLVRRSGERPEGVNCPVVRDIRELGHVAAALLAVPSRKAEESSKTYLQLGIATVDSFDIHSDIAAVRQRLGEIARAHGAVSVLSAGWDPGTDSVMRTMLEYMAPRGITYTNFGPGMSMGHSVAVRSMPGVADALSMTMPAGDGVHRRMVYVQLEPGADFGEVTQCIKHDPYFVHDETHVMQVEDVAAIQDMGHGVLMTRKGASGNTHNQTFRFDMRINNPALTAQIMTCAARAALRQQPGCYTLVEIPPVDMLPGDRDDWVARLV